MSIHRMRRLRPRVEPIGIPWKVTAKGIENAQVGSIVGHVAYACLGGKARNRRQHLYRRVVVELVESRTHEKPIFPEIILAFPIDSLKRRSEERRVGKQCR